MRTQRASELLKKVNEYFLIKHLDKVTDAEPLPKPIENKT